MGRSDTEVRLGVELEEFFTVELHKTVVVEGKRWVVDVLLPEEGIAVEFDGAYQHRGRDEMDMRKTAALEQAGLRVIRLREAPLEPLGPWDVVVSKGASVHALTVAVLEQVETVRSGEVGGLGRYREGGRTRADEKADAEIDRIAAEIRPEARAARAAVLDRIFGSYSWRHHRDGHLLFLSSELAEEHAAHLDEVMRGREWRGQPGLLGFNPATLNGNAAHLDELLRGRDWRQQPTLLTFDPATLDRNATHLNELLRGCEWRKQPTLLTFDPATLDRNAAHLDELFRGREWRRRPNLLWRDATTLDRNAAHLDELLRGREWRRRPDLLGRGSATLDRNAAHLDELLRGREWRGQPSLLGLNPATLDRNAAHLDELLHGCEWRGTPTLLTRGPATLDQTALLLTNLTGSERWQTSPYLLAFSPNKVRANLALLAGALGEEEARSLVRRYPTYLGYPTQRLRERADRILAKRA